MELKKLVKNTSYLVSTKVAQFFAGIVRSKINAVLLGTVGVGIVNQLTFLGSKMGQFTMIYWFFLKPIEKNYTINRTKLLLKIR